MVGLAPKWVRLAQDGTNPGVFFRSGSENFGSLKKRIQNVLKSDLKKSQICPIWGQSDPHWAQICSDKPCSDKHETSCCMCGKYGQIQ